MHAIFSFSARTSLVLLLTLGGFFTSPCVADDTAVLYVHAVRADLKAEPKAGATAVSQLKRGVALVVEPQPSQAPSSPHWVRVRVRGGADSQVGFVSKLFVRNHPPVGQADLDKDVKDNSLEKASRRRTSSYSASAATRGYTESSRTRVGRAENATDEGALREVEAARPPAAQVEEFRKPLDPPTQGSTTH